MALTGELFDGLVTLYADRGEVGGYTLKKDVPALTLQVERRRGGVEIAVEPSLGWVSGLDFDYLFSEDTLWRLDRAATTRMAPALKTLCGKRLFFTSKDATAFCSYVLPELGRHVTIEDPERLLSEPDPAGTGDPVLSGCTADGGRQRTSGIFVRRGPCGTLYAPAAGPFAG